MDWKKADATHEVCGKNHILKRDVARAVTMGAHTPEHAAKKLGACYGDECCRGAFDELVPFFVTTLEAMRGKIGGG